MTRRSGRRPARLAAVSRRRGFSLIEIFFVLLVLGALTLIAIPKIRGMKRKAFITMLTTDLRNLQNTQELYWHDAEAYTTDLDALRFTSSADVMVTIPVATAKGWSANVTHTPSSIHCSIYIGDAPALPPATAPGVISCAD
ncbi:MAG: type IV pilin protein [Gemmatimonadaceae bacterium]